MSANLFSYLLLSSSLLLLVYTRSHATPNPGQEGHGGHPLLVEFSAQGKQLYHIIAHLQNTGLNLNIGEKLKLKDAVFQTRLEFINEDIPNPKGEGTVLSRVAADTQPGREGKMVIQFSRPEELRSYMAPRRRDYIEISRYVLHEYLLAAGIQDDIYQISSLFKMPVYKEKNPNEIKSRAITFEKYVYVPILPLRTGTTYWNATGLLLDRAKEHIFDWLLSSEAIIRAQVNPGLDIDYVLETPPSLPSNAAYVTSAMHRVRTGSEDLSSHWERVVGLGVCPLTRISLHFVVPEGFVESQGPILRSNEYPTAKPTNEVSFASYAEAFKNVYYDIERKCADWVDSIREKSGESYVFAHCQLLTPRVHSNPNNANEDIVSGEIKTIYYLMSRWQKLK